VIITSEEPPDSRLSLLCRAPTCYRRFDFHIVSLSLFHLTLQGKHAGGLVGRSAFKGLRRGRRETLSTGVHGVEAKNSQTQYLCWLALRVANGDVHCSCAMSRSAALRLASDQLEARTALLSWLLAFF
jgi:hypothetical protein